jgi:hypothetical protein
MTAIPTSLRPFLETSSTRRRSDSPVAKPHASNALGRDDRFLGKLYKNGHRAWSKQSWALAHYQARLDLGQSMYKAGIDNGQLCAQIHDLDERILRAATIQAPSKALKLQREKLILQLADTALAEEGPLPGADIEYQKARQAEAALAHAQLS